MNNCQKVSCASCRAFGKALEIFNNLIEITKMYNENKMTQSQSYMIMENSYTDLAEIYLRNSPSPKPFIS